MLLFLTKLLPTLLFPVGLTILLCLWVTWRLLRAGALLTAGLAFAAAAVLCVAASPIVSNKLLSRLEEKTHPLASCRETAAIVLLGGGMIPAGAPRIFPETGPAGDRVLHAARLWRQKCAPTIVTTGGYIGFLNAASGSEAREYASLLSELFDVPASALLQVPGSLTTADDARLSARLFDSTGMKRDILLVTSASHMPRAAALFRGQGFTVTEAPTDFNAMKNPPFLWFDLLPTALALDQTTTALHEYAGTAVNALLEKVRD